MLPQSKPKNPKRVAAGRLNRAKRGEISAEARQRLRELALARQPWQFSTGPKSAAGKAQAARNGKVRQQGDASVREVRREMAAIYTLLNQMREELKVPIS